MAALSMCFQLMADEAVAKFKWIGEKVGLAKKEPEEGEGDEEKGEEEKKN